MIQSSQHNPEEKTRNTGWGTLFLTWKHLKVRRNLLGGMTSKMKKIYPCFFFSFKFARPETLRMSKVFANADPIWDICSSSYLHLSKMNRQHSAPCSSWSQLLHCFFLSETKVSSLICLELNCFCLDHSRDHAVAIPLCWVLGIYSVLIYSSDLILTLVPQS